jgi:hypothetical protein
VANEPVGKTEHNGAKNSGHDKWAKRADLKQASRKRRRLNDRLATGVR